MSDPTPADPDTHVIRVTREPRPDGGAVYHVTVDAGSEAVIAAGCLIEGVTGRPTARDGELMSDGPENPRDGHWGEGTMVCRSCGRRQATTDSPGGAPFCEPCDTHFRKYLKLVEKHGLWKTKRMLKQLIDKAIDRIKRGLPRRPPPGDPKPPDKVN